MLSSSSYNHFIQWTDALTAKQRLANQTYSVQPTSLTKAKIASTTSDITASSFDKLYFKNEFELPTNSFKWRGAMNAVIATMDMQGTTNGGLNEREFFAASTGNHGLAVATSAKEMGANATIAVSTLTPQNKVQRLRDIGANVIQQGDSQDESFAIIRQLVKQQNGVLISQFSTKEVVAGHMTIAMEIVEQLPEVEQLLIPLSGGGLFTGIALAMQQLKPKCRLIGVSMQRGATMYACLQHNKVVPVEELATLADSLGGGVEPLMFTITRDTIAGIALVNENMIYQAIADLYHHQGVVVEGAAAVTFAAFMMAINSKSSIINPQLTTVALLTGSNIDPEIHQHITQGKPVTLTDGTTVIGEE